MFTVRNHRLYQGLTPVPYFPSPNHGGVIVPRIVVIHFTDTEDLRSPLNWLRTQASKVSAHLLVGKDGAVYQLLPFNVLGWHVGVSEYEGQSGVNGFSIGIENVGTGREWPEAQVEANRDILTALGEAYQIEDIFGPDEVAMPPGL
jgi:N-acetylmuramoyl-L-alanine amidase